MNPYIVFLRENLARHSFNQNKVPPHISYSLCVSYLDSIGFRIRAVKEVQLITVQCILTSNRLEIACEMVIVTSAWTFITKKPSHDNNKYFYK